MVLLSIWVRWFYYKKHHPSATWCLSIKVPLLSSVPPFLVRVCIVQPTVRTSVPTGPTFSSNCAIMKKPGSMQRFSHDGNQMHLLRRNNLTRCTPARLSRVECRPRACSPMPMKRRDGKWNDMSGLLIYTDTWYTTTAHKSSALLPTSIGTSTRRPIHWARILFSNSATSTTQPASDKWRAANRKLFKGTLRIQRNSKSV